jgi:iron complex transport system substrate-binding protein
MNVKRMQRWLIRFVAAYIAVTVMIGCDSGHRDADQRGIPRQSTGPYSRIVSMAPNITETLYALGQDARVVGVSRFCTYPPEVAGKPSVGGYLDPNYEAVAVLEPDMVLILTEHGSVRGWLDELGIAHQTMGNRTVGEIIGTIKTVGSLCDAESAADSLIADITARMDRIRDATSVHGLPRVLVSIGRTLGSGTLSDVYIAGAGTFYDELIRLAGGTNAYDTGTIAYPLMSAEGILHLNPDIIIDLVQDVGDSGDERSMVMREWESVPKVAAVRDGRVHLLTGSHAVVPGPRFILLLEDMAKILHPEVSTCP